MKRKWKKWDFQLLGERSRKESTGHTVCPLFLPCLCYPSHSDQVGKIPGPWFLFSTCRDPTHNCWAWTQETRQTAYSLLHECSCLSPSFCLLGLPWCFPLFGLGSASAFYWDFISQMPDKISTGSTTYPQTQHWQAKLDSFPNNFSSWHPCFSSWLDLKTTIIFDASFSLSQNAGNNQPVRLTNCLFHPLPFKHQGHISSSYSVFFRHLSRAPLISHLAFSHSQLFLVLHPGTGSFWNSSNPGAFLHKKVQWPSIAESGACSSDWFQSPQNTAPGRNICNFSYPEGSSVLVDAFKVPCGDPLLPNA